MIVYSRVVYLAAMASWFAVALAAVAVGVQHGSPPWGLAGIALALGGFTYVYLARARFLGDRAALRREGDLLVGAALRTPLPVGATSFELAAGGERGFVVLLHFRGAVVTLAPEGWKVPGERRFTRAVAARALTEMGLEPHSPG